ncbi:MAG: MGMT family protein [Chloroflexi bacterium]|nr:MGMT family protein [Chloroflexota bacterium]
MSQKARRRSSWREKLADSKDLPKVEEIAGKMSTRWGTGTVVIPAPKEVDEIMREVPVGKLITINQIRAVLARKHGATICCPMTTGIFAWIAAHAAAEAAAVGETGVTPYWRTLKGEGELNAKYPGGLEAQWARLQGEGHEIEPGKGKKPPRVVDFARHLIEL